MNRCLLAALFGVAAIIFTFTLRSQAQTTEFMYQGNLQTSSVPANGTFDFEFRLFSALSGGTQAGSTLARSGVIVSNGVFSVNLDFGGNFPGADRYLDVSVRQSGGGSFVSLTPRSQILSTPYAIKSVLADSASTVSGPITGASTTAMLSVTNTQPGIIDPSPVNLPPVAIKGETTSTVNSTVGVLGISASGAGVVGITNSLGGKESEGSAVVGIATNKTGENIALDAVVLSPNGIAVSAEMPSSGTGYYFKGTDGQNTNFSVRSNGNVEIGGTLFVNGTTTTQGSFTPLLLSGGADNICKTGNSHTLRLCSSSLRYKKEIHAFTGGIDLVKRLNPISFTWKETNTYDFGLGAEEVAAVEPLLVTHNDTGQIEGVKYDRVGVVLINAVKTQQAQIDAQQKQIEQQQNDIKELRSIICTKNRRSGVCKAAK